MSGYESDVLTFLYQGLHQALYEDVYSHLDFPVGGQLSERQGCEPDLVSPCPQSPILRSMSPSSVGTDSDSPGGYPTPLSDSSVATPALSEASFGWLPGSPFGLMDAAFALEAKAKVEPECSYVHGFPESAPLSPNAFVTYAFDACKPFDPLALPTAGSSGPAGERRHSEPANIAALQFPLFLQEQLSQISLSALDASSTCSVPNNTASSSPVAEPSSIAPHETQLPHRLEIVQPKPVRAYKPPILRGDLQYDPKDFVRRHSEPILPLRELDVFSHVPLDVADESPEDDSAMFGGSDGGSYGELEDVPDDIGEEMLMDDFAFDGLDEHASPAADAQEEALCDAEWLQEAAANAQLFGSPTLRQPWPGAKLFTENIDWAVLATPSVSGLSPDTHLSGFRHL
ncbi:hypothetical protein C8Q77DRAFT_1160607 [Trametes polyzona]|nr:hypothetical protein C8Q77DRAFT_1160607 [Trametes polyzona]